MRRREVVRLLAGAAMCPGTVRAQPGRVRRVGFLWGSPTVTPDDLVAFRERGFATWAGSKVRI